MAFGASFSIALQLVRSYVPIQSETKMLPDEDSGAQSWCWPLFEQVWKNPVWTSGRSGPSTVITASPCRSWTVLLSTALEKNPNCRTINFLLSSENWALAQEKYTLITMARIRMLDTLQWHAVLLGWGTLLCRVVCSPSRSQYTDTSGAFLGFYKQQESFILSESTLMLSVFGAFSFLWWHVKLRAEGNLISLTVSFHAR